MTETTSTPPPPTARLVGGLLLGGWALYITVVTLSNLSELVASFGWARWSFRSGNLAFIATTTEIYLRVRAVNQVLLGVVVVWEALAGVLLWRAAAAWTRGAPARTACARTGLVALAMLWFAFGIATELFVAYDRGVDESAFWTLAAAVLATLAVVELVGAPRSSGPPGTDAPLGVSGRR